MLLLSQENCLQYLVVHRLLGSETLSDAGETNALTNTLFQGNFNFSGAITTLSIEVSGRDVNLGIGPLFCFILESSVFAYRRCKIKLATE